MRNVTSVSLLYRVRTQADTQAWDEFAELYYALVNRWLRSQGVQPQDADDVVQEVMTYVYREIGNFDHNGRTGAFRHWLRQVMVNRLREFWRAAVAMGAADPIWAIWPTSSPTDAAESAACGEPSTIDAC